MLSLAGGKDAAQICSMVSGLLQRASAAWSAEIDMAGPTARLRDEPTANLAAKDGMCN